MKYQSLIKPLCLVGFILTVTACAAPPPYVLVEGEFQRSSAAFLNGVSDRQEVKVCYAKRATSAKEVTALARSACALDSKTAVFRQQSFQICPLVTPIAAIYDCVENAVRSDLPSSSNLFRGELL